MQNFCMALIYLLLFIGFSNAQTPTAYYIATGKDSITYCATDIGLLILKRNSLQELYTHSRVFIPNKNYLWALDNEHYVCFLASDSVYLYSLENKLYPSYLGALGISGKWLRPFGENLALMGGNIHRIIGIQNDTFKVIASINASSYSYFRTLFYPDVVYPYFFNHNNGKIIMYKFMESTSNFILLDTLDIIPAGYNFVQMYAGGDHIFIRAKSSNYISINGYEIISDSLIPFYSGSAAAGPIGFIDEIECTENLIRTNGTYKWHNHNNLNEPNGFLSAYANMSGSRIYNTLTSASPHTKLYYSKSILGNTINSAQFVYTPPVPVEEHENAISFAMYQNYPNPFNPFTTIKFSLPERGFVNLSIYSSLGEKTTELINEEISAGIHSINFNAEGLASGVYFYKITAGEYFETRKMIYLK